MDNDFSVTGIILYTALVGDYDKRLVILTKELGKITVFSNGSRRPGSMLRSASQSYVMGNFAISKGHNAYTLHKAEVINYFSELSRDIEKMCYAAYFCEFISYYTREGDNCINDLNLLYFSLLKLSELSSNNILTRRVFELRLMDIEGQGIQPYSCVKCGSKVQDYFFNAKLGGLLCDKCAGQFNVTFRVSEGLLYTLQYIMGAKINELFAFDVKPEILSDLSRVTDAFITEYVDKKFNSLEILVGLT